LSYLKRIKQFTVLGKTFKVKAGKRRGVDLKCTCGSKEFSFFFDISMLDINEYEKYQELFGSMEAYIMKCKKCGKYYLEREVWDYDYFYVNPLVEVFNENTTKRE